MTSGTTIPSSALNLKASSTHSSSLRNQPVRSPSDRHSSLSKSNSPTPETVTTSPPSLRGLNGDSNPRLGNGQDESEAETEILSDEPGKSKDQPKKRVVNHEHRDRDNRSSPALSNRTDPRRKHADCTRSSSMNGGAPDKRERKSIGNDKRENGHAKPASKDRLRLPLDNGSAASRAQSADASMSPQSQLDRDRQAHSAEPRKRKFSDSQRPSKLEPPRQKPRLDGTSKAGPIKTHHKIRRPSSPPQPPTPATRTTHKRSASTQSAIQAAVPAVQSRKKRESSISTKSSDRQEWNSGSSSEDESRLGPPIPLLAPLPRSSRSTQRALASPARTMPLGSKRADRYGLTPLLKACERGSFEGVKQAYEEAPAELDQPDNGGFAPLQKAALGGHADIVQFLLEKGCGRDCYSTADKDSPLIDAVDNGHVEVVKILLAGGVNPHHQNNQGKRAIDAVKDADAEEDEKAEMKEVIDQAMRDFEGSDGDDDDDDEPDHNVPRNEGPREDLLYIEPNRKNLIEYSRKGDVVAVGHFIESVKPTVACAVVAARGGHHTVLNLLLAAGDNLADPDPSRHDETPMLAAIGRGHLKIIKLLLATENFNPTRTTREGKRYYEVAEQMHGPKWQREVRLLKDHYDAYVSKKKLTPGSKNRKHGDTGKASEQPSQMSNDPESPKAVKHKRLMKRKDMSGKDSKRNGRPKIDSSQSEASDSEVRITEKPLRVRKGSMVGKTTRSGPPSPVTNRQPSGSKSKTRPIAIPDLKPPAKETRMSLGPRKVSSHSVENHPPSDQEMTKDVQLIKQATPEEEREAQLAAEKERLAEVKRQEEATRLQQEAEQRKRDEEAAAKEAERKAAEIAALEAERKAEEERVRLETAKREREERLNALPRALRIAVQKGRMRPLLFGPPSKDREEELGISMQFLPIHLFNLGDIEPNCEEAEKDEQLMMSFQVVGILGLPSELRMTEFPDWKRQEVTLQHRKMFLRSYDLSQLAQEFRWLQPGENGYHGRLIRDGLAEAKEKFLAMQPLSFVRYADFLDALKKPEYDHLAGLKMRMSTRCCVTEKVKRNGFDFFGDVQDDKPATPNHVNANVNVKDHEGDAAAGS